jgi:hypothetical protein
MNPPTPPDEEHNGGPSEDVYAVDIPLMAGTARIWPDSLYVEFFSSRSDLINRGNAGKLLREALIQNSDPTLTSGQVFEQVPQWAKEFSGLEAHERDHTRRLLSTSYGLLGHAFRNQELLATRDLTIESAQSPNGLTLPFDIAAKAGGDNPSKHALRAIISSRLRIALEHQIALDDFRAVEPALAGWTVSPCEYVRGALPGDPSRSALSIAGAGKAKWLTAAHLLELFGCCEQGNRLLGTGGEIGAVVELLENSERMYTLPMLMWFSQFPTSKDRPKSNAPHTRPGELYLGFYRGFPLELFAAADLALWPPFTPEGFITDCSEIDWTDISPAYRFARILIAYRKLGISSKEWPEGDLNQVIPAIQKSVCEMLAWPTPTDLADRWLRHLESGNTRWFVDAAAGGFRRTTAMQLLALRRDRPGDVVVNNVDYDSAGVRRSAGWLTREAGMELTPHTLASDSDRGATEFWLGLYAFLPALYNTGHPRLDWLRSCSPEMRRACVESFDIWGRGTSGWPSELFQREASTLLRLSCTGST